MRLFSDMTADEIAAHRDAWRRGDAELWRATTRHPSKVDRHRFVESDHDAPTLEACLEACRRDGGQVVRAPHRIIPERRV